MNEFEATIENIANTAKGGAKVNEGDFYKDGLLHCGKCGRVKETLLEFPVGSGRMKKFPCVCDCNEAADKAENERMKREARERRIKDLQRQGLTEARYYSCTFANDDGHNPSISAACKRYVDKWQDMKEKNIGILFYGNVGTGKSFYACCIANALLNMGVPAQRRKLDFGDYSAKVDLPSGAEFSLENAVCVERKMSLDEICNCYCRERKRFAREFERAKEAGAAVYLLIENASWESAYAGNYRSKMTPKALIASLTAWTARYDCKPIFCKAQTSGKLIKELLYREMKERLAAIEVEP